MALKTPAKLQRLILKAGALPKVEHLHRNEALFAALEWEWKPTPDGAHIFPDYAEAVAAQEMHGGFPVYLSADAPATPEPAPYPKPAARPARIIAERVRINRAGRRRRRTRDPRAVFADLERRALA